MNKCEREANSRNFNNVQKLVSDDLIFWFTDGSLTGIECIRSAFLKPWNMIRDEKYSIENLKWVYAGDICAVCL